jgi:RNA polymerase sigma-70 factor (ECF subfamily)
MHPGGEWLRKVPRNPFQAGCVYVLSHGSKPAPGSQVDDQQLIGRIRAGDPAAERQFFETYADRIHRIVYRFVGDPEAAQDCVQETFIRAFERLGTFRGESALGTWLGAIAVSVALNALRGRRRDEKRHAPWEAAETVAAPSAKTSEPDLKTRLHAEIDQLPEGYRMVFLLHDVEGYTHEEIGTMLGVQSGTSKAQLFRARARLRDRLADFAPEVSST